MADTLQIQGGQRLTVSWSEGRRRLNESPVYQALKASDGLLDKSFGTDGQAMIRVSEQVDELLLLHRTLLAGFEGRTAEVQKSLRELFGQVRSVFPRTSTQRNKAYLSLAKSIIEKKKIERPAFLEASKGIHKRLSEYCVQLESLEVQLKRHLGVTIALTEQSAYHRCRCGNLRFEAGAPCVVCGTRPAGVSMALLRIHPVFKQVIENHVWLELAVARLLETKGFEVLVGPTVVGMSGTEHEIDIVARDRTSKILILGEVTIGPASLRELADLMLRGIDVPAHGRVLVTLGASNSNTSTYAQRHGIGIVSEVGTRQAHLDNWVTSLRRYHAALVQT